MTPDIEPLTSSIAARVHGVRLTDLDEATVDALRDALHAHGVLVFPEQNLTREEQVTLARRFGPVHGHPVQEFMHGGADVLSVVSNDKDKPPQQDQQFHVDYSFHRVVPDMAILRAEVVPERGGDTVWCSAGAAYDALSDEMKRMLTGLSAGHEAGERFWFEMTRTQGEEFATKARKHFTGNRHSLVGPHPYTGRTLLFVNPGYTSYVAGLHPAESDGLLRILFTHLLNPGFHYRHKWREGDVVFWDEHLTTHMGPNDFYPNERRLTRVTSGQHEPAVPAAP